MNINKGLPQGGPFSDINKGSVLDFSGGLVYNINAVNLIAACVAQLVVQLIRNEQVAGSSPVTSSKQMA